MTVSGIPTDVRIASEVGGSQGPRRPNVSALRQALQDGDMGAAKEAFAEVYKNVKSAPTDGTQDTLRISFKRLVTAVEAGDVSAARDSLKSIDAQRPAMVYSPGQLPGVAHQAAGDFAGLVKAIRAGDADASKSALDGLRGGLRAHYEYKGAPVHSQPTGEPLRVPDTRE